MTGKKDKTPWYMWLPIYLFGCYVVTYTLTAVYINHNATALDFVLCAGVAIGFVALVVRAFVSHPD